MSGKQVFGDAPASNLAGMSKTQLYDIMSQMKTLIEQNQDQARLILTQNPPLTRALFQAQIMLGMVKSSEAAPSVQPQASQKTQPPMQQTSTHGSQSLPGQTGPHEPTNVAQAQNPLRRQQQNQPPGLMTPSPIPGVDPPSVPSQPVQQHMSHPGPPAPTVSQIPNIPSLPLHSGSQPPAIHQPPLPPVSAQFQQPMQVSGASHLTLQPPLVAQSRPISTPLPHQFQGQVGPNVNLQHSGAQHSHHLQPTFHSNIKPPSGSAVGPPFPHGQAPVPNQQPPSSYQGGHPHLGADFSNQGGSAQGERGSSWPPGPPEIVGRSQLPGPPPFTPGPMGPGNQPARPMIPPEMEQVLLQQVMSLTPEQINLLPPEQRSQVLQLQQMLRH